MTHLKYSALVLIAIMLALPSAASAQSSVGNADKHSPSRPDYKVDTLKQDDEAPTDDPYEQGRRSVREGLKRAMKEAGVDQESAKQSDKAQSAYPRDKGTAPRTIMQQALAAVDPEKKMTSGERSMAALGKVYKHYMDQGYPEKAKSAAASMFPYYRQESDRYLALSQAATASGELDKGDKAAAAAYTNIQNGRDLKITKHENGYEIRVTDQDGCQITKQVVDPRDFAAAAMGFNPATFDEDILNAAGVVTAAPGSGPAYACGGERAVGWQADAYEYGRPTVLEPKSYFSIRIDDEELLGERFGSSLPCVAHDQITCTGDGVVFHFNEHDQRYVLVMGNKANDLIPDPISVEIGRCSWLAN